MKDNTTSQPASKYDGEIVKTHPYYQNFNQEIINLVKVVQPNPKLWLDTGCGTGILAAQAIQHFPNTHFILADPSEAMIETANNKLNSFDTVEYLLKGTEEIECANDSLDVITAVLSHHYFDLETRTKVTDKCYQMLKPGGVYITFENISPHNEKGIEVGLNYWEYTQILAGKSSDAAKKYKQRFGNDFYPITIEQHLTIMRNSGFSVVEVLFLSGLRAGFFAIK